MRLVRLPSHELEEAFKAYTKTALSVYTGSDERIQQQRDRVLKELEDFRRAIGILQKHSL